VLGTLEEFTPSRLADDLRRAIPIERLIAQSDPAAPPGGR
jgi:hypothetical protein